MILKLNKRQNEIQQFGFNHERMQKEFNENEHEKYKFKGAVIEEDYMQKEEYRDLGNQEVIKMGNNKIKEQDEKIGYITLDVKKDTQLAKAFSRKNPEACLSDLFLLNAEKLIIF